MIILVLTFIETINKRALKIKMESMLPTFASAKCASE